MIRELAMKPTNRPDNKAVTISPGPRMRAALVLAIAADLTQMIALPWFLEGAASPLDDALDLLIAGILAFLLGWHWEFLPSFACKLIPGVDIAPLWTIAVANVYRKARHGMTVNPKE
jgi:hypothetical protein